MTNLLAPVHEFYHQGVALDKGMDSHITGWNTTETRGFSPTVVMAGWTADVVLASFVALFGAGIGRWSAKGFWVSGGAGLGYAFVSWIRAYGSYDFNSAFALQFPKQFPQIHDQIVTNWTVFGIIDLVIVLIVVLVAMRRKGVRQQ